MTKLEKCSTQKKVHNMPVQMTTDTGRIVWGHPLTPKMKKYGDGPQKGQQVLRDGKPVEQYSFGVAYPKPYFDAVIRPQMIQEVSTGFPQGTPQNFAWKITDGDGVDSQGKPFNQREGYAGCYVLAVSTESFAPPVFKFENGQFRQLTAAEIKCGDYVACALTFKLNIPQDRTRKPSVYVNPNGVNLIGYGQEIQNSSFDPSESFGSGQFSMPAGASAMPVSSAPAGVAMPGQPAPQYAPQPQPLPQPAHDFVQNAGQQPGQHYAPQPQPAYAANVAPAPQYAQPQPVPQYAAPATSSPSNGYPQPAYAMPGQPQQR